MINRAAILLAYKQPAVNWINEADPYLRDPGLTLADVNCDRTVYLINEEYAESDVDVRGWIMRNYRALFEAELTGWYTDEALWPKHRDLALFDDWFEVQCHTVLIDLAGGPLFDDGL